MEAKKFEITVCVGPGCKAWDSELLIRNLKEQFSRSHKRISILQSQCLNNCGGGVTLKLPITDALIKLRNPDNLDKIAKILREEDERG